MARLLSVNVGLPRDIVWKERTVHTGVWKNPVTGRCRVGRLNLEGDGQGDLAGHGGEHRAVFVYQTESYRYWQEQLKRSDFVYGQFGENFTIEGLADDAVCIGDRFQIDTAHSQNATWDCDFERFPCEWLRLCAQRQDRTSTSRALKLFSS
jgi:MOSC domain-containing protein YiiM